MPSVVEKTFKVIFIVKGFSIYADQCYECGERISSGTFPIEALGCTQWRFHLYARAEHFVGTDDEYLKCVLTRFGTEERRDISFELNGAIIGKGGLRVHKDERFIDALSPRHSVEFEVLPIGDLTPEKLDNDQLNIRYEIREIRPNARVDSSLDKWADELRILSDDMRKLLKSGYQSDVVLKSSDGRSIPVHFSVLFARWKELKDAVETRPRRPRVVVCPHMSSAVLEAFVFYLYTGTILASDVTVELFEYVVGLFSSSRALFYTLAQEMSILAIGRKESVAFTWLYEGGGADFHRVLPLQEEDGGEILVDISTVGSHLEIRFSLSEIDKCVVLNCTVTLVCRNGRFSQSADHCFQSELDSWYFPDFMQMSLLNGGTVVEFEVSVNRVGEPTCIESTVTEFKTGSRDVRHIEFLASGLQSFFMEQVPFLEMFDLRLKTSDGFFYCFKSVLGTRSDVLGSFFRVDKRRCISFSLTTNSDSETVSSVLEYLYTGWTYLGSLADTLKIYNLAVEMSLHGLVEKCLKRMTFYVRSVLP